jgi:hypothetical protein
MRSRPAVALAALTALLVTACGGPVDPSAENRKRYPAYERRFPELFDDAIEPAAVGITLEDASSPKSDNILRERTQVGDGVARVVVTTVTQKKEETGITYQLDLRSSEVLAGKPPEGTFPVRVRSSTSANGILGTMDVTGKRFVAFLKTFVRADGDTEVHFHLSKDDENMQRAVKDAAALQELK